MEKLDIQQTYHTLQNLNNIEISYLEYSNSPKDFYDYSTFLEYFNNCILQNKHLFRFYFPIELSPEMLPVQKLSELEEITETTIVSGYDFSVTKQFNFPSALRHKCHYYTLIYLYEGSGELFLDEATLTLQPGDFYLIPPGVYYTVQTAPESICLYMDLRKSFVAAEHRHIFHEEPRITNFILYSLTVGYDGLTQKHIMKDSQTHSAKYGSVYGKKPTMDYFAIHAGEQETIRTLVLAIFTEYLNQAPYSNTIMKDLLSLLFALLLRDHQTIIETSVQTARHDQLYQQITQYLKQNYQTTSLSLLSEHLHFSKQYLCKVVKEKTGNTFQKLLMDIRLEMAEQYLRESGLTLEHIAYLCGFTAASHFSRVFKKQYGMSPSAFRKQRTGKG